MNRLLPNLKSFAALLAIAAVVSGAARAADLSEPVILVASSLLDHTPFQQAVVLATPLDDGAHIGFILPVVILLCCLARRPVRSGVRGR